MKLFSVVLVYLFTIFSCFSSNELKKDSIDIIIGSLNVKISEITTSEVDHSEAFPLIDSALILGYSNKRYQKISPIVANYSILLVRDGYLSKAKQCINKLMPFHCEMDSTYYGILLSKRGIVHKNIGDVDSAKADIILAIDILQTSKYKILLADSYYSLASICKSEDDIYGTIQNLRKASNMYFDLNYTYAGNVCMGSMADLLSRMDLYNESLTVFYELKNNSVGADELLVCTSLLDVYDKIEREKEEKQILEESLNLYLNHYDSLKRFQQLIVDGDLLWYYLNIDSLELAKPFFNKVINNELYSPQINKSFAQESKVFMYYIKTKNKDKAIDIYTKYVNVSDDNYSRGIYDLLNAYADLIGDEKLQNDLLRKSLNFHKDENRKTQINKMAYLYAKFETEKKEQSLIIQESKIELLENENTSKSRLIMFSVFSFLLLIIIVLIRFRLVRSQKLNIKNEKEILKLQTIQLSQIVMTKEMEISEIKTNIVEKETTIEKLKETIDFDAKLDKVKNEIFSLFSQDKVQANDWIDFKNRFEKVPPSYFDLLVQGYPELSPSDKKMCALIKINMSSKEIANILLISPKSVDQKKYRLKKKMTENSIEV